MKGGIVGLDGSIPLSSPPMRFNLFPQAVLRGKLGFWESKFPRKAWRAQRLLIEEWEGTAPYL